MKIFIEKEYFYARGKGADPTDYFIKAISSVMDVYALLRDNFKDLLEAEMGASLGYEKNQKGGDLKQTIKEMAIPPKTLKSQYKGFPIDVPIDLNREFEPKFNSKYQWDISGIKEKVISLYAHGMGSEDIHDQLQGLGAVRKKREEKYPYTIRNWEISRRTRALFSNLRMITAALCIALISKKPIPTFYKNLAVSIIF